MKKLNFFNEKKINLVTKPKGILYCSDVDMYSDLICAIETIDKEVIEFEYNGKPYLLYQGNWFGYK